MTDSALTEKEAGRGNRHYLIDAPSEIDRVMTSCCSVFRRWAEWQAFGRIRLDRRGVDESETPKAATGGISKAYVRFHVVERVLSKEHWDFGVGEASRVWCLEYGR